MKAVFWGYKFPNMKDSWAKQLDWVALALNEYNVEVVKHNSLICNLNNSRDYDYTVDNPCDLVIYNHCDISHLFGNVVTSDKVWFFKPTVPTKYHTTLDELGYGPYSTVTYSKPDFEKYNVTEVNNFFDIKVKKWIEDRDTKWGNYFENQVEEILDKDYCLVLGQCGGDEVVTRHDFGSYFAKLLQVIAELVRITNDTIIVKLHPYTDGEFAKDDIFSNKIINDIQKISKTRIKIYSGKSNIHNFIKNAKYVVMGNSGAGFEAMMHHKPIISWGFPEYHWVTYDLRHLCDLYKAIKLDWFDRGKSDKFLYWYLEKYCFYDLDSCKRRVKELLNV